MRSHMSTATHRVSVAALRRMQVHPERQKVVAINTRYYNYCNTKNTPYLTHTRSQNLFLRVLMPWILFGDPVDFST